MGAQRSKFNTAVRKYGSVFRIPYLDLVYTDTGYIREELIMIRN